MWNKWHRGAAQLTTYGLALLLAACGGGQPENNVMRSSAVASGPVESRMVISSDLTAKTPTRVQEAPTPSHSFVLSAPSENAPQAKSAPSAGHAPHQIGWGQKIEALKSGADLHKRLSWTAGSAGSQKAALRFVATGASGVRLALAVQQVPPLAVFRFYGKGLTAPQEVRGTDIIEAIYSNLAQKPTAPESRIYFAPYIGGDEVTMEIELPAGTDPKSVDVHVPQLSRLSSAPDAADVLTPRATTSSYCEVDVICRSADWSSISNGTARMVFSDPATGGSFLCTGTLLNDRANSNTPYFLTANHCISDQASASTLQTFWFYRSATCGGSTLYSGNQTLTGGATLLYTNSGTDTTLLKLNKTPPAGVTYVGWSPDIAPLGASIGGVHHPRGDKQKVSLGSTVGYSNCTQDPATESFNCVDDAPSASASHLRVQWDNGITEQGSSGSGVYLKLNNSRYLVGQLSAGSSSCANTYGSDMYGRFDLAYTAALSRWLDSTPNSAPRTPIYRFYNATIGSHFFTANASEKDYVIANMSAYRYEGIAFYAYAGVGTSLDPVYRLFNTQTGTHFYTISGSEKTSVTQTLTQYRDEGAAWYAKTASDGTNTPLYRFYNTNSGTHFYTLSAAERDNLVATLPNMRYEGIGYYAWTSQ